MMISMRVTFLKPSMMKDIELSGRGAWVLLYIMLKRHTSNNNNEATIFMYI